MLSADDIIESGEIKGVAAVAAGSALSSSQASSTQPKPREHGHHHEAARDAAQDKRCEPKHQRIVIPSHALSESRNHDSFLNRYAPQQQRRNAEYEACKLVAHLFYFADR